MIFKSLREECFGNVKKGYVYMAAMAEAKNLA